MGNRSDTAVPTGHRTPPCAGDAEDVVSVHATAPTDAPAPGVDYRTLLEGSLDMIWLARIHGASHRFIYASPSSLDVLGVTPEAVLRSAPEDFYTPDSLEIIAADVDKIMRGHATSHVVVEAVRPDGRHIWLENKIRVLERNEEGELTVAVYLRDVTERKLLEDQLARMAFLDGLTGIENRRSFDAALEKEWKSMQRSQKPLSLILLDVDHFKAFNDNYGHLCGDDCLRTIARTVRSGARRPEDVVARYGGEEIAVLLPHTGLTSAARLAGNLCSSVEQLGISHRRNDARGVVTMSGGVSTAQGVRAGDVARANSLVLAADSALYEAKRLGRNRVETRELGEVAGAAPG